LNNQVFQANSFEVTHKLQNNPSTLFIQFLRFKYNPAKMKREKIDTSVVIPEHITIEGLNYIVGGFINHLGAEAEGGHYTCHIKKGNLWFLCDDDKVSDAKTFDDVKEALSHCYVLMLLKKDEALDPLNPH
jgi:ubiquitin C-terminal hydrolase